VSLVLDASAALAWIFERTDTDEVVLAEQLLGELSTEAAWVPSLWFQEVANALLMAERKGVVTEARVVDYLQRLKGLPIAVDEQSVSSRQEAVIALGRQLRLTAYDATYLELALRKGARLATFDAKLAAATQEVGGQLYPKGLRC
jgi:predicted nucleic acid-binding protein